MTQPKYPHITVELSTLDGNVFWVIGLVRKHMRMDGLGDDIIKEYIAEATSGNYDHALRTTMQWVNVE